MAPPDGKRRLPVLQAKDTDEDAPDRPPWHWIFVGAGTTVIAWLALATLMNAIAKSLATGAERSAAIVAIGGNLLAFGLAALAGGLLVGRFGGRAGSREAALGGGLAAAGGWGFSALVAPLGSIAASLAVLIVLCAISVAASWGGAKWGVKMRGAR